ncbi:transposase [Kribbella solani]
MCTRDLPVWTNRSWTTDRGRCRAAGVPDDARFATKPALAREMITRALETSVSAAWVSGDEVYGADSKLRAGLHERAIGYVLAWPATIRSTRRPANTRPGHWPVGCVTGLEPAQCRHRCERAPLVRLGADRHLRRRGSRRSCVAGPPIDQHR